MKRFFLLFLSFATATLVSIRAETESIDLKALAKKARPAVMLLVVSDANGKEIATGTGFLVSSDGKLLTNHHVIEGAASAVAKSENGGMFPVEGILVDDLKNDLVLLKLAAKDLPFLTIGESEKVEVGTRIAVIGSPLGLEGTMSEGIVSAVRELMGNIRKLQITAAISPGSSGSPVMNAKGDVIGIASSLLRGGQSLNFAIPVDSAKALLVRKTNTSDPAPLSSSKAEGTADIFELLRDADFRASFTATEKGDYAEALKRIKSVAARYPQSADVYVEIGKIYVKLGFDEEVKDTYKMALKLLKQRIDVKPDDDLAWSSLGALYIAQGKYPEAIVAYKQAVQIAPFSWQWFELSGAYTANQDYPNAIEAHQQAIKLADERFPDGTLSSLYWESLGDVYVAAHELNNAIEAYKNVTKRWPKNGEAWHKLGVAFRKAGRTDDAVDAVQRAKLLKPELFK